MNRKKIIILGIGVLLIILTFWGAQLFQKPPEKETPAISSEGKPPPTAQLKEKLLKDTKPALGNPDFLIILESEKKGVYGKPRFEIQYQAPFDLFLIVLLDAPLKEVRQEAEEALLKKAEGNLSALCQLNFLVGAPRYVSEGEELKNRESLNICLK